MGKRNYRPVEDSQSPTVRAIRKKLASIQQQLKDAQSTIAEELQDVLRDLAGQTFSTHDEAADTTKMIQGMMQQLGLRARCPNTGEACNLRCTQVRKRTTTFQFDRYVTGEGRKVTASFTVFPEVELVAAPPDRRGKRGK